MTTPFLVRGDTLPEFGRLAEDSKSERSRGLLWGVDLAECRTRRQPRDAWHEAVSEIKAELDSHPEIRRICVAHKRPKQFPQSALVRMPEGLAPDYTTTLSAIGPAMCAYSHSTSLDAATRSSSMTGSVKRSQRRCHGVISRSPGTASPTVACLMHGLATPSDLTDPAAASATAQLAPQENL